MFEYNHNISCTLQENMHQNPTKKVAMVCQKLE